MSENFSTRQFHYLYSVNLSGEQLENFEIKKPLKFNTETLELDNPKIRKSWNYQTLKYKTPELENPELDEF